MCAGLCRASNVVLGLMLSALVYEAHAEQTQPPAEPPQQPQEQAPEQTMALWKERDLEFIYRSPVVTHTCQDLRYRVASVLVAVGARPDLQVQVDGCDAVINPQWENREEPWQPSNDRFGTDRFGHDTANLDRGQSSRVRIHLLSPVEVTPAAIEEWKKSRSRRELVARVTGDATPILEMTGQFPAEWQKVTLTHHTADLEPEDCALLEQMSSSVLRQLGVRKIRTGSMCDTRQPSRIPPQLTVEALMSNPYGRPSIAEPDPKDDAPSPSSPSSEAPATEPATPPAAE